MIENQCEVSSFVVPGGAPFDVNQDRPEASSGTTNGINIEK